MVMSNINIVTTYATTNDNTVSVNSKVTEWNSQPGVFQINREEARATFFNYDNKEQVLEVYEESSSSYKLLNGNWKFNWAKNPSERIAVKDGDFNKSNYNDED